MILSNFNVYTIDDVVNFEGLNMLSTMFSVMFCFFNCFLGNMVIADWRIRTSLSAFVFSFLTFTLMFTNFTFNGMNTKTMVTMFIAVIYIMILIPAFDLVS